MSEQQPEGMSKRDQVQHELMGVLGKYGLSAETGKILLEYAGMDVKNEIRSLKRWDELYSKEIQGLHDSVITCGIAIAILGAGFIVFVTLATLLWK